MSTNFNTCFIDSNGADVSQEFVEKSYLLDVYPNLINPAKAPSLWLWACNIDGNLGTNSTVDQSSPVQTVSGGTNWKEVHAGCLLTAAIKTDGTLWLWGNNLTGQLGNNSVLNQSSPVQTISGGTNWKQVSSGCGHSAAIKTDGTLWLWGEALNGRLGNNLSSLTKQSSPVQTVSAGTNWKQVSLGTNHSAAIKTDGSLWLWGCGTSGALGQATTTANQSSPVQTASVGTNWKQVSLGGTSTTSTSAAIKTDGTLWLWGDGTNGILGNNATTARSSPVQTVSGGTNWKQVSLGSCHSAAIKTDGSLWLWGLAASGRLGNNSTVDQSTPVQTVSGGTNWKQVSAGTAHTAAIKTDGTLWLWGFGTAGRLGDNSTVTRSSPVQTILAGNNWKQVSAGGCQTAAIKEEGDW